MLTQSDTRLVKLAGEGHERAFEALVHRYRRPLLGYCRRLLLPSERAEDALQQGLLQAWLALQNGAEVQDARPWLYRIVHNAALNMLRVSGYDYAKLSETLHGADAPEEDLDRRIAVREAFAGLAALPAMQREALLRTAVDGHSHEQVAQALGLTEGALRGLVYRARATLRTATTALTPSPLVSWALSHRVPSASLASRLAEMGAGGGSVGVTGLLLKGGAVVVTAGALAGGIATDRHSHARAPGRRADAATQTVAGVAIQPTASIDRVDLADANPRTPAAGRPPRHGRRGVVVRSRQPGNTAFHPGADTRAGGSPDRTGGRDAGGGGSTSTKSGSADRSTSGSKDGGGSLDKASTDGKDLSGSNSTNATSTSDGTGDSGSGSTDGGSTSTGSISTGGSTSGGSTSGGSTSTSGGSSSGGSFSGSGSSDFGSPSGSGSGSGSTDGGSTSTSDGSTSGASGSGGS